MIGTVAYTLIEFLNFYLVYRNVFGVKFRKGKRLYSAVLAISCVAVIVLLNCQERFGRDSVVLLVGIVATLVLTRGKKWKVFLLYPIVFIVSSAVNTLGSYGLAFLLGISHEEVCNSIVLTLLAEFTAVLFFSFWSNVWHKNKQEETKWTWGQYVLLLIGCLCFFVIVAFSQGLIWGELEFLDNNKEKIAIASILMAITFIILSIWQQITWRRAFRYQKENEKYQMFLAGQEEHIRMLILEDERKRKLRHDMNAHILAMDQMVEKGEWEPLKAYLSQMKESLNKNAVEKYTGISAVDAIISEWHVRAVQNHAVWEWSGSIKLPERVTLFELCIVFSNLLSNAVEAVERQGEGGLVLINVSNYQDKIVLSIGNTCDNTQKNTSDVRKALQTTKEDKLVHGLGHKNVEEIIQRQEGSIDYKIEDDWFQVDIVL